MCLHLLYNKLKIAGYTDIFTSIYPADDTKDRRYSLLVFI